MARKMKTPDQAAAKYGRRVQGAAQDYTQGVQNATGWAANAIAAGPRRNAGLQAAIASGSIDRGIQSKGDAGWQAATLAKGPAAWTASVAKAQPAYQAGMTRAMSYQQAAQAATAGIDTTTVAGRLQKAQVWAQTVHQQSQAHKGGH